MREDLSPFRCKAVVPPLALTRLLDPLAFEPPAPFHSVQHRVEGRDVESQDAVGPIVNQLGDFVAVTGPPLDRCEDHEFRAAALDLGVRRHMWWDNISRRPDGVKVAVGCPFFPCPLLSLVYRRRTSSGRCPDPVHGGIAVAVTMYSPGAG